MCEPRHTPRRVWQRLVNEPDANVGESTVRRYAKVVRERQQTPLVEVAVPQYHPQGYRPIDRHGQVIDVYVSMRRNVAAATRLVGRGWSSRSAVSSG